MKEVRNLDRKLVCYIDEVNGSKISIMCAAVEESLSTTMISRSKLVWLKDNEPSTYTELATTGRLQEFLDQYDESYFRQHDFH